MKAIDVPISRLMENVYAYSGLLFSLEKDEVLIYYDTIKAQGHYTE